MPGRGKHVEMRRLEALIRLPEIGTEEVAVDLKHPVDRALAFNDLIGIEIGPVPHRLKKQNTSLILGATSSNSCRRLRRSS